MLENVSINDSEAILSVYKNQQKHLKDSSVIQYSLKSMAY